MARRERAEERPSEGGPSIRVAYALTQGTIRLARFACESNGGGGGSRTRVRESFVVGIYMRSRP